MEVRDAIKAGKTTGLILTGGVESNGPHLATGKHNFVLKVMGEAIARKLGNALVAPILTLEPGRPDGERVAPGSVVLSAATYRAVLTDMANSLRRGDADLAQRLGDLGLGEPLRDPRHVEIERARATRPAASRATPWSTATRAGTRRGSCAPASAYPRRSGSAAAATAPRCRPARRRARASA